MSVAVSFVMGCISVDLFHQFGRAGQCGFNGLSDVVDVSDVDQMWSGMGVAVSDHRFAEHHVFHSNA